MATLRIIDKGSPVSLIDKTTYYPEPLRMNTHFNSFDRIELNTPFTLQSLQKSVRWQLRSYESVRIVRALSYVYVFSCDTYSDYPDICHVDELTYDNKIHSLLIELLTDKSKYSILTLSCI